MMDGDILKYNWNNAETNMTEVRYSVRSGAAIISAHLDSEDDERAREIIGDAAERLGYERFERIPKISSDNVYI